MNHINSNEIILLHPQNTFRIISSFQIILIISNKIKRHIMTTKVILFRKKLFQLLKLVHQYTSPSFVKIHKFEYNIRGFL